MSSLAYACLPPSPSLPCPQSARELSLSASIRGAEACRRGMGGAGCLRLALLWLIYAIELLCPGTENGSNCRSKDKGVGVAGARGVSRFIVVHLRISVALKFSTKHAHTHTHRKPVANIQVYLHIVIQRIHL